MLYFSSLNPGSDEAIARGCTCPVLDNGHGNEELALVRGGFFISEDCPIHNKFGDTKDENQQDD